MYACLEVNDWRYEICEGMQICKNVGFRHVSAAVSFIACPAKNVQVEQWGALCNLRGPCNGSPLLEGLV